jgi:hyperosmotically inducible protein
MTFQPRTPLHLATAVLVASCASLNATETDERIIAAARASYNFMTYLKDDKITIVCKGGAVTLTGKVRDEFHRALAEETLAGLPGVQSVNNQLSLAGDSGITPDTTLKARVETALLFHRQLSSVKTQVAVENGVVTLRGEADSGTQKSLATEYVKGLDGVVRVNNEMTVAGEHRKRKEIRKKIDDASITAQIKLALLFNKATSAVHTKVHTDNGFVTLAGTAKSQAERDLATRIVKNVEGVRRVRNQMTVE